MRLAPHDARYRQSLDALESRRLRRD